VKTCSHATSVTSVKRSISHIWKLIPCLDLSRPTDNFANRSVQSYLAALFLRSSQCRRSPENCYSFNLESSLFPISLFQSNKFETIVFLFNFADFSEKHAWLHERMKVGLAQTDCFVISNWPILLTGFYEKTLFAQCP